VQTNISGSTVTTDTQTFQMFKDSLNYFHIHRVDNEAGKTAITQPLAQLSTEITVGSGLANQFTVPDLENNVPGVIWIASERMEFWGIDTTGANDILTGVTRGTLGTSAIAHFPGAVIVDGGRRQQIPGVPDYWDYLNTIDSSVTALAHTHTAFNDLGVGLQASTNVEANFINLPANGGTIRSLVGPGIPANSW
jgi:hypothetical protein